MKGLPTFVCSAALALAASSGLAAQPTPSRDANQSVAPLATTSAVLRDAARVEVGQRTTVRIPVAGGDQTLELVRFNPLTSGSRVVEVDALGNEHPVDLSDLAMFQGTIAGDPDSLVFVSVHGHRVNGFVRSVEGVRIISTGQATQDAEISYELAADLNIGDGTPFCAVGTELPIEHMGHNPEDFEPTGDVVSRGTAPCRVARIAIDTDYEFTQLFGGNTGASAAYALTLLGASSSVYERDVNVRLAIPYLRVFASNNDPYFGNSGTLDFLFEMRDHWNTAMRHVPRETVQGLSGRSLGGGVAYVNALCSTEFAHGVSANLNGFFPLPVQDNSGSNWDLMVVSHELGHNFGTGHTHDSNSYSPTIDECGNGDCALALDSTIMSYCHLCPGGLSNVDMRFHPRVQTRILEYLDSASCDLITTGGPAPVNDSFVLYQGQSVPLDVLSNDEGRGCTPTTLSVASHDATSAQGGTLSVVSGSPLAGEQILYTPPAGFVGNDSFTYTTSAGSASVDVTVVALRPADTDSTEPGVETSYYDLPTPALLPDFDTLTPYDNELIGQINFESTNGSFAGSGLTDNVGAVFETLIEVPQDGWYQLAIESDDGSRLYLGDDLLVDNDGLHGMRDRWNYAPLSAGKHRVRIEFFEAGGGAGMIMRYAGSTVARQPVPASALSHSVTGPCPADLAPPFGELNFFDVSAFIGAYNAQDPAADIAEPFGSFNFFDVSAYITLYNAGCP